MLYVVLYCQYCDEITVLLCCRFRESLCWYLCVSGEDSRVFCRSGHHGVCRHQCPPDGEAPEAKMKRQIYTNKPVMHFLILRRIYNINQDLPFTYYLDLGNNNKKLKLQAALNGLLTHMTW